MREKQGFTDYIVEKKKEKAALERQIAKLEKYKDRLPSFSKMRDTFNDKIKKLQQDLACLDREIQQHRNSFN